MTWWNCPMCKFEMEDDGSVAAAQRMDQHIGEHEREEPEQKERAFQKWLADGHPGVGLPPGPHSENEFRCHFEMVGLIQALRDGKIGFSEYGEQAKELARRAEVERIDALPDSEWFELEFPEVHINNRRQ